MQLRELSVYFSFLQLRCNELLILIVESYRFVNCTKQNHQSSYRVMYVYTHLFIILLLLINDTRSTKLKIFLSVSCNQIIFFTFMLGRVCKRFSSRENYNLCIWLAHEVDEQTSVKVIIQSKI